MFCIQTYIDPSLLVSEHALLVNVTGIDDCQFVPIVLLLKSLFIAAPTNVPVAVKFTVSPEQIVVLSAVRVILQFGVKGVYVIIFASHPDQVELYPLTNFNVRHPDGFVAENIVGVPISGFAPYGSTPIP